MGDTVAQAGACEEAVERSCPTGPDEVRLQILDVSRETPAVAPRSCQADSGNILAAIAQQQQLQVAAQLLPEAIPQNAALTAPGKRPQEEEEEADDQSSDTGQATSEDSEEEEDDDD